MPRKTIQNKITTPELIEKINPKNIRLVNDFMSYLTSIKRSSVTKSGYLNDLHIFLVWNLLNNDNKFFIDITKRDFVSYQNWLISENKNSPARVRRLKSTISSLSNYISNILDDEFEGYKPNIRKIENPSNEPVREKTVLEDSQMDFLLDYLVDKEQYQKACCVALAMCSGVRKTELTRFKVDYFKDENIIYGSLYKTPEKILTKGRNGGKLLTKYILSTKFKKYLDLWLEQRKSLNINSEWLFVDMYDNDYGQIKISTLNSWAISFSNILNLDFYFHSLRHYFTTHMARLNIPDSVIAEIVGWESQEMVKIYKDIDSEEEFGKYFDENGIKQVESKNLKDL